MYHARGSGAFNFRVRGSAICYAITWDSWGHNDMRPHLCLRTRMRRRRKGEELEDEDEDEEKEKEKS